MRVKGSENAAKEGAAAVVFAPLESTRHKSIGMPMRIVSSLAWLA